MANAPIVVSLPIADRQTSFRFYRDVAPRGHSECVISLSAGTDAGVPR